MAQENFWIEEWFAIEGWADEDEEVDSGPAATEILASLEMVLEKARAEGLASHEADWAGVEEAAAGVRTALSVELPNAARTQVAKLEAVNLAIETARTNAVERERLRIEAEEKMKLLEAEAETGRNELASVKDPDDLAADLVQKTKVDEARKRIADQFTGTLVANNISAARKEIAAFQQLVETVDKELKAAAELKRLTAEAETGRNELASVKDPDDLATDEAQKKRVDEARKKIADQFTGTLVANSVSAARKEIAAFQQLVETVDKELKAAAELKRLNAEAETGRNELASVKDPDDLATDEAQKKRVDEARKKIADQFTGTLVANNVSAARKEIAGFQQLVETVDKELKAAAELKRLTAEAETGRNELATVKDPDDLATDLVQKTKVDEARKKIADRLTGTLVAKDVADARGEIAAFQKLVEQAGKDIKKGAAKTKFKDVSVGGLPLDEKLFDKMFDELGGEELQTMITEMGSAEDVATACSGFKDEPDGLKKLQALMKDGLGGAKGLKTVFKDGCKGDATKLKEFAAQFPAEEDRKALGKLLKDGFDGKGDALGHLLGTGCDGSAVEFKKLATAFKDDTEQAKLKGLMTGGGFGDKPEVLAHAFKTGCGGDPANLKKLHETFKTDLTKLSGLLTSGGLAEKPDTFGKVLGTGLDKDPAKLKKLQEAFDGPTELAKLKTIMEALENDPSGEPGKPGEAIKTLMDADHLNTTDYRKLNNTYYAKLKTRAGTDDAKLKKMLRAGPTFTRKPSPATPANLPQPDNLGTHGFAASRMEHFLARHTRQHYDMTNSNHADNNSFFPDGTTAEEVKEILKEALVQLAAAPTLATAAGGSKKYVPLKKYGMWVQVGVKKVPPPVNAPTDSGPGALPLPPYKYVDQLFPIEFQKAKNFYYNDGKQVWFDGIVDTNLGWPATPKEVECFDKNDMKAIREAIRV